MDLIFYKVDEITVDDLMNLLIESLADDKVSIKKGKAH